MLIEQAIFTSAQTARLDGYQLVASSPGVCEADARELTAWGASHDALLETGLDAVSVNVHPLPSGAWCVAKTTPAGGEYSHRRGQLVYSQCLVVPPEVLARFGNNPFALLTAAFAQGSLRVLDRFPAELEPIRLAGKAAPVDQVLLGQLIADPGVTWVNALLEAVGRQQPLVLITGSQRIRLMSGLLNCLPVECRTELSFSTGLKYSPRRPFRVVCLNGDPAEHRRRLRQYNVLVLELNEQPPVELTASDGWGGFVACAIATGKFEFLAHQLSQPRPGLQGADLRALGNELLNALADQTTVEASSAAEPVVELPALAEAAHLPTLDEWADELSALPAAIESRGWEQSELAVSGDAPADDQRPDLHGAESFTAAENVDFPEPTAELLAQAHQEALAPVAELMDAPSQQVRVVPREVIEQLELLDDIVFDAIAGKTAALEQMRRVWADTVARLGSEAVEESREQYIRHAMNVWRTCTDDGPARRPEGASQLLDVLCLLMDRE